jgi:hypothetical protein
METVLELRKMMKIDLDEKLLSKVMCAFFGLGACAYGCMFVTYLLWFLGLVN